MERDPKLAVLRKNSANIIKQLSMGDLRMFLYSAGLLTQSQYEEVIALDSRPLIAAEKTVNLFIPSSSTRANTSVVDVFIRVLYISAAKNNVSSHKEVADMLKKELEDAKVGCPTSSLAGHALSRTSFSAWDVRRYSTPSSRGSMTCSLVDTTDQSDAIVFCDQCYILVLEDRQRFEETLLKQYLQTHHKTAPVVPFQDNSGVDFADVTMEVALIGPVSFRLFSIRDEDVLSEGTPVNESASPSTAGPETLSQLRANGSLVGVILILDMSKSEEVIKSRLRDWRSIVLRFYGYSEVRIVAVPRFPSSPEEEFPNEKCKNIAEYASSLSPIKQLHLSLRDALPSLIASVNPCVYLKRNQVKGCESERRLRSCDRSRSLDLHYAGQELFYSYPCRVSSVDSGTESYYGGQEHQRSQDVSPCIPTSGRSSYYLKRPASSLEPIVGSPLSSEDVGHFSQTVDQQPRCGSDELPYPVQDKGDVHQFDVFEDTRDHEMLIPPVQDDPEKSKDSKKVERTSNSEQLKTSSSNEEDPEGLVISFEREGWVFVHPTRQNWTQSLPILHQTPKDLQTHQTASDFHNCQTRRQRKCGIL